MTINENAFSFYQYVTNFGICSVLKKLCPDKQRELERGCNSVADCKIKIFPGRLDLIKGWI